MGLALAAPEVFAAHRPESDGRRLRLLVVDDEYMASTLIALRLRQSGFQVETAVCGEEALEAIHERAFDLVLLDRLMPGLTGDGVLQELRASHSRSELPVIMVSALDDSAQIAEALELGANDYITKPIDFTLAVARIRAQLDRNAAGQSAIKRNAFDPDSTGDGSWDWNLETGQIYFCPRWLELLGLRSPEMASDPQTWFSRVHPQDLGALHRSLDAHRKGQTEAFEQEYRIRCHDEAYRWMSGRGVAFRDAEGKAVRMVGCQSDIGDTRTLDALTGLPNRPFLAEKLAGTLERKRGSGAAVLLIDVDRFRLVNDSFGVLAGDQLLREYAARIETVIGKWRSAAEDRHNSLASHLGGDRFAALLDGISSPLQAVSVADELLQALRPKVVLGPETGQEGCEFCCTASIGVALSGSQANTRYQEADDLLQDAEAAMCSAKAREPDCWDLFSG